LDTWEVSTGLSWLLASAWTTLKRRQTNWFKSSLPTTEIMIGVTCPWLFAKSKIILRSCSLFWLKRRWNTCGDQRAAIRWWLLRPLFRRWTQLIEFQRRLSLRFWPSLTKERWLQGSWTRTETTARSPGSDCSRSFRSSRPTNTSWSTIFFRETRKATRCGRVSRKRRSQDL
jgi:hypothetical protein